MKSLNILFITIDGGGNLPPMFGLAHLLSDRGHNVRFLSEPCMKKTINKENFNFTPFIDIFQRTDRSEDIFKDWNAKGPKSPAMENVIFGTAKEVVDETIKAIKNEPTDLLMVDCILPTAAIAAEAKNIPSVIVQHFPEYLPGPNRPPGLMGLLPGKGIMGHFRDHLLAALFNGVVNKYKKSINKIRVSNNLNPFDKVTDIFFNSDLRLVTTLKSFDFPIEPLPKNFYYSGPILNEPDWIELWSNPWNKDDKRPLVIISLSTTFQNQARTIQSSIDALKKMEVRGLVTLGPAVEKESFNVPDNVIVVKSAPHSHIFPIADLVITHAGHGTVMRSLQHGVPLICLPMGRDQGDNAVKITYHGCGINLKSGANSVKINKAVQNILADKRFKTNAQKFQERLKDVSYQHETILKIENLCEPRIQNKPRLAKQIV